MAPKKPVSPAAPVIVDTPAAPPAIDAVVGVTPAAPEAPEPQPAPMPSPDVTEAPVAPPDAPAPVLDVAAFQAKVYEEPRCWELVSDVYLNVLGAPPTEVQTVSEPLRIAARAFRVHLHKEAAGLEQQAEPEDFAIVLMWPNERRRKPHCGIFYQGKVLHATPDAVLYQDLASLRDVYGVVEFWGAS